MIFKIFSAMRSDVQTEDTGTYADGLFQQSEIALAARKPDRNRSAHERDYGAGRKIAELPPGLA